jgi:hypothetical protein
VETLRALPGRLRPTRRNSGAGGVLWRAARFLWRTFGEAEPPLLAVEIRPRAVALVRLVRQKDGPGLGAAVCLELPEDALRLTLTEPGLTDPAGFASLLRGALERAGAKDGGRAALVLPDAVARVALLPAAEVGAASGAPREELVRFKLRKSVPFDIREARLALGSGDPVPVVAIARPVLEGFESACVAAGLEVGRVELASLALLRAEAEGAAGDCLFVNWEPGHCSLILSRDGQPLLFRSLSGPQVGEAGGVEREVASTILYHGERLGGTLAGAVVRSGWGSAAEAVDRLSRVLGFPPTAVNPWRGRSGVPVEGHAAVAGALASLAAA